LHEKLNAALRHVSTTDGVPPEDPVEEGDVVK